MICAVAVCCVTFESTTITNAVPGVETAPVQLTVKVAGELGMKAGFGAPAGAVVLALKGVVPPVTRNVNCVAEVQPAWL